MRCLAVPLVSLGLLASIRPASAQSIDAQLWVTNGKVRALANYGNTLFVGGDFTTVGPWLGGGVPVDPTTGAASGSYPKVSGMVNAAVPDGADGWYIGGSFTSVGGVARTNLAHILSDLTVGPWNPTTDKAVTRMAREGSTIYLAGAFTQVNGTGRERLAAVDAGSGVLTAWDPAADAEVRALATGAGAIYVGGSFLNVGGESRSRVAALDPTTGLAQPWNPAADAVVQAIVVDGARVFLGGAFANVGGASRSRLAAVDVLTGMATSWLPSAVDGTVHALVLNGGDLYAGGEFTHAGSTSLRVARFDPVTGVVSPTFGSEISSNMWGAIRALAVDGSALRIAGDFTQADNSPRSGLAAADLSSGDLLAWDPNPNGKVQTMVASGSRVYLGGGFTSLAGLDRWHFASIDLLTGQATAWAPFLAGKSVSAIAHDGSQIYVASDPYGLNDGARIMVGDLPYGPTRRMAYLSGSVHAIACDPARSRLYVGGSFTFFAGGVQHRNLLAMDTISETIVPWYPDPSQSVLALALSGSTLYAGGVFTTIGGVPRARIAAMNAVSGAVEAWAPESNGSVTSLAPSGPLVYVGGSFSQIGGQSRRYAAALDASTGAATTWNPDPSLPVKSLVLAGPRVYAGGSFDQIGGLPRKSIASLVASSGFAEWGWDPGSNLEVSTMLVTGGRVYAGGTFTEMSGERRLFLAGVEDAASTVSVNPPDFGAPIPTALTLRARTIGGRLVVSFALPDGAPARLEWFDVTGRRVTTHEVGSLGAGTHELHFEPGEPVRPGVFLARLSRGGEQVTARGVYLK